MNAIKNNKNILIVGKAGSGKTRLLIALLERLKNDYKDFYFYVGADFKRPPSKHGVIVMDDIHEYYDKFKDHLRFLNAYGYGFIIATAREEEFKDDILYSDIGKEFVRIDIEKFTEQQFKDFLRMLTITYGISINGEPNYTGADFRPAPIVFAFRKAKEEKKERIDASEIDRYIREKFGMIKGYIKELEEIREIRNTLPIIVALSYAVDTVHTSVVEHIAIKKSIGTKADMDFVFRKLRVLGDIDDYITFPDYVLEYTSYWQKRLKPISKGFIDDLKEYSSYIAEMDNKFLASNYLNNISNKLYLLGELDEALKYHQKACGIDKELGDKQGMANQLGNIGALFMNKGDYDEALKYLQKAYEMFKDINPASLLIIMNGIADILKNINHEKFWVKYSEAFKDLSSYNDEFKIKLARQAIRHMIEKPELLKSIDVLDKDDPFLKLILIILKHITEDNDKDS